MKQGLLLAAFFSVFAATNAYEFDLSELLPEKTDGGAHILKIPAGKESEKLIFDLDALKIVPNDFDEVRILYKNVRGVSSLGVRLTDYPAKDEMRSWYSKIALAEGKTADARFDFRCDDDGWWWGSHVWNGHRLEITISKQYRRTPGEPPDRLIEIEKIEFVKRRAEITFSETDAVYKDGKWIYRLFIRNRESAPLRVGLRIDTKDLNHFRTDWTTRELTLAPRAEIECGLILSPVEKDLPPLYAERVLPKLVFEDGSTVYPLIGYRPRYLWANIPPPPSEWNPPSVKEEKALLREAEEAFAKPFAAPPQRHAEYCAIFKPREMEALSFFRMRDRKTGGEITDPKVADSYIYHYNAGIFKDLKTMAQAWRITKNLKYAERIRDILLEYAAWYQYLPPRWPASTSAGTRLSSTTLDLSYFFNDGVDAYAAVRNTPAFGKADRDAIENDFLIPEMMNLYRHNIEFTNMQLHHIGAYASAAIVLNRNLNLLGEALYGDHGFHSFLKNGFTADGIALEGGVYHPFGFIPLLQFAERIRSYGIELVDERFKKIFDHGILCTPAGVADGNLRSTYPLAWRIFRDPKYLPTLKVMKSLPEGVKAEEVPDFLFLGNTLQKNNGYLWLRENGKYGFRALAINYIMGWDRMEHDRLHYRLFDGEGMLSHEVWRVGYTNPGADMEATVSHNTPVVDEKNAQTNASLPAAFLDRPEMPGALFTENPESRLYEEADFSRAVAIFDGLFFVGDLLKARDGKEHTFDFPFYSAWQPGARQGNWEFRTETAYQTPFKNSYQYVTSALSGEAPDGTRIQVDIPVSTPERGMDLNRKSDRVLSIRYALPLKTTGVKFLIGRGHNPKPGPMFLLRQRGTKASAGAVFEVVPQGGEPRVKHMESIPFTPEDPLSAVWKIEADSGTYLVVVNRTGRVLESPEISTKETFGVYKR